MAADFAAGAAVRPCSTGGQSGLYGLGCFRAAFSLPSQFSGGKHELNRREMETAASLFWSSIPD
jgi:hypothetical protein